MAGVPGASFNIVLAKLSAMGFLIKGITLSFTCIDRFLVMTSSYNRISKLISSQFEGKMGSEFDKDKAHQYMNSDKEFIVA